MIETLANGYSSESTQRELSNEYQYDRVKMVFKNLCILVLWTKVAKALKGLKLFVIQYTVDVSLTEQHLNNIFTYIASLSGT